MTVIQRRSRRARPPADGSGALAFQVRAAALPAFETQYRFAPPRRWTFDLAFVERQLAVEVDGGLFIQGGHSRGSAREDDMEKDAEALCLGWRVLRVSTRHVRNGVALQWIERLIKNDGKRT